MSLKIKAFCALLACAPVSALADPEPAAPDAAAPAPAAAPAEAAPTPAEPKKPWNERISLRGYIQFRHNRIGATNPELVNPQGDKSIGGDNNFFIRRARLTISGDLHERVYLYFQPDFVSAVGDSIFGVTLRDLYADLALDDAKEFRLRVGQSKIPFGFENMQSSSNRLPLDRGEPLNSALKDERDVGVFFMWAPAGIRRRLKLLADEHKGSGDYGVVALGAFNGQTANKAERNENLHVGGRVTYPFLFGTQFLELSAAGYAGRFVVSRDEDVRGLGETLDARAQVTFVLYPQPFGVQAEWNVGVGPERVGDEVQERALNGGYVLLSYRAGAFIPFVRGMAYDGGKKFEKNAPRYHVREVEAGVEWHINPAAELTGSCVVADRTSPEEPYAQQSGAFGRAQLQINF